MIKLFKKTETEKYIIIKILFIKITFKKKSPKSDIDAIVWWIPFKNLRNAIRNIYYEYKNNINQANCRIDNLYSDMHRRFDDLYPFMWDRFLDIQNGFNETQKEIYISRQLYSNNNIQNFNSQLLVSVIIPVYNIGEKYLRQCLESAINQSYKNIEIIIVNDCSAFEEDDKICLEYANRDSRVKYIKHKENMGDGVARMTGLKEAKGYSVLFMDGDDYAALNLLEVAMSEMVKNNVDIVCYNFFVVREENNKIYFNNSFHKNIPYQIVYGKNIMELFCNLNVYISGHLWNKLFKREILLELGFNNIPARYRAKDLNYTFKIFLKAKSVLYIPLNLYFYIINRNNSVANINRCKDSYFTDWYYIFVDMFDYLNKKSNDKLTNLFAGYFLYHEAKICDRAGIKKEENHFLNLYSQIILDLIDYGAIDKNQLLENVKSITNDKNLINWLCNI